jgi:transketolase
MTTLTEEYIRGRLAGAAKEIKLGYTGVSIGKLLIEYASKDRRVCYVGVDTTEIEFQKRFPDRAFDVGIAEQDELGVATGLAKMGMIPVVQAWSPFTPMRNFDQLRTSLARHRANVKIVTTALGLANCSHGATHHDMESFALFRVVPNLVILAPFDDSQFEQAFRAAMNYVGPVVIMGPPEIYAPGAEGLPALPISRRRPFQIGRAEWLRRGRDATIIAYGAPLRYSWVAAERLEREGISVGVLNMCSLKPLDEAAVIQAGLETGAILTVEEQNIHGGLGGAVAEIIAECGRGIKFKRMGIPDQFVENLGDYTETRASLGLTAAGVARALRQLRFGAVATPGADTSGISRGRHRKREPRR